MSDLPSTADIERTCWQVRVVPIATGAPQQTAALFDHFVGGSEQLRLNVEAERLSSLEVDDELKFSGLHDWQVGWLFTLENPPYIDAGLPICVREVCPVAGETTSGGKFFLPIDRRNGMLGCHGDKMISIDGEQRRILSDSSGNRAFLSKLCKCSFDLRPCLRIQHDDLHADTRGRFLYCLRLDFGAWILWIYENAQRRCVWHQLMQ